VTPATLSTAASSWADNGRNATPCRVSGYPDDVLVLPSRSRPGGVHQVQLNVLTNAPSGCSCEAWTRDQKWCWAMDVLAAEECSYRLQRCAEPGCGALLRLGRFWTGSGEFQRIFVCALDADHFRREAAAARLLRVDQPVAVGSRGSWRLD